MNIKTKFDAAFTVVEILVVVVIIGILATIVIFSYSSAVGSANDTSVQADLQKVDDAFKLFALDNGGVFPDTTVELATVGLKLSSSAYYTGNRANVYVCTNSDDSEYAVIAMSKSKKRFVIKSESGVSEYTGSVVWDAATGNWAMTCSSIDATYAPLSGNVSGMDNAVWNSWTGVAN